MNYDFMGTPMYPGQSLPQDYQNMAFMSSPPPQRIAPTVGVVPDKPGNDSLSSSYGFTIVKDNEEPSNMVVPIAPAMPVETKKKRAPKKSTESTPIVKANNGTEVVDTNTVETYTQTTEMLHESIRQLDYIAVELKDEMEAVKANRNARNRSVSMANLGETLGRILDSKIRAISEINSTISKSNDLDYKREKDLRAAAASSNSDDKKIMDLYNAMIHNPGQLNTGYQIQMPMSLPSANGMGIIRAPLVSPENAPKDGEPVDIGYLDYLARMSPEQNAMFYENDPNVQVAVVFDHATGKKFFQAMNFATGQAVPNIPVPDQRFMDDTYIDLKSMTARNSNLNTTYPVVEINKGITSEY